LLQCCSLLAASAITVEGPREWIECLAADGLPRARLYLLPDTDYLSWDALHAGACSTSVCEPAAAGSWRPVRAHLLRFTLLRWLVCGCLALKRAAPCRR
jgi:hypothetical protein